MFFCQTYVTWDFEKKKGNVGILSITVAKIWSKVINVFWLLKFICVHNSFLDPRCGCQSFVVLLLVYHAADVYDALVTARVLYIMVVFEETEMLLIIYFKSKIIKIQKVDQLYCKFIKSVIIINFSSFLLLNFYISHKQSFHWKSELQKLAPN